MAAAWIGDGWAIPWPSRTFTDLLSTPNSANVLILVRCRNIPQTDMAAAVIASDGVLKPHMIRGGT